MGAYAVGQADGRGSSSPIDGGAAVKLLLRKAMLPNP